MVGKEYNRSLKDRSGVVQVSQQKFQFKSWKQYKIPVVVLLYFLAAFAMAVKGRYFLEGSNAMGYSVLELYILLPLLSIVCSISIGRESGWVKWLIPFVFGIAGFAVPYFVFYTICELCPFIAFIPSAIGVVLGSGIAMLEKKKG